MLRVFLSHNKADKEIARPLGAYLVLAGTDVWFDEWEIQAGDSIPGKLNEGLADFDVFLLLWSKHAARSKWVRRELESAIHRSIESGSARVVPCLLDETPLPQIIRDIKGEDFSQPTEAIPRLVDDLMGFRSRRERLLAIQQALDEMDIRWNVAPGMAIICCPKCGIENTIKGWQAGSLHGTYAGLRCTACGWEEGGEI